MKKIYIAIVALVLFSGLGLAIDYSVNLNFNYSFGAGDFFKTHEQTVTAASEETVEKMRNRLGLGFDLGVRVRLIKKLYLIPSYSLNWGHQKFEAVTVADGSAFARKNYYFQIHTGNLNVAYEYLTMKNGWTLYALTGVNFNRISADEELNFEKKSYLGWMIAQGFVYRQVQKLGFNFRAFYKTFFSAEKISYIGLDGGVMFRF